MSRRQAPRDADDLGRRRRRWSDFRQAYPRIVTGMAVFMGLLVLVDAYLGYRWFRYSRETGRLRAAMNRVESDRADNLVAAGEGQVALMMQIARLQATGEPALNLAISLEEGRMYLQREGARLRDMPIKVGPDTRAGDLVVAAPRGKRAVVRIVDGDDAYELPTWAWSARGLPVPASRAVKGGLGPLAIVLSGGTVIYSSPAPSPLDDPDFVLPGSVRAEANDLQAIRENVRPGMPVYFH
jgi:hypothetical protein